MRGPAPTLSELSSEYNEFFNTCEIRREYASQVAWYLTALRRGRTRYEDVASKTGAPWYFIGIIHGLETSFNFLAHLHNGDTPLTSKTKRIPKNRPDPWLPPSGWAASAQDAMAIEHFTGLSDWSLDHILYRFEAFNGFGSRTRLSGTGYGTPYLWSFSNHYEKGKFFKDRKWNPDLVSEQRGAGVLLRVLVDSGEVKL